jgi:hypothetical protein
VAVLACAAGGAFVASRYNLARSYALFAGLALLLIPLGSYAVSASGARSGALEIEKAPVGTTTGLDREFPNIYLVVPDGYARADHLERLTQYDNEGFLRQLEERGFHVARHATSNYTVTGMSMASMLDTSYVVQEESGNSGREALNRYIAGDNATLRRLRELGYRYVAAPAGGYEDELCAGVEDLCVAPLEVPGTVRAFTETEVAFLEKTPLGDVIREFLAGKISRPYADPSHVVETVHASALPSPYFVLVHMLQPHPPFQFGPDCAVQQTIDPSLTWWGPKSDSMERGLYVGSLQCVNKMLLAAADKVARDDPTAIIAIQSDHGTPYTVDWHKRPSEWEQDAIAERLGILSALRMPRSCDAGDDERTAVNSLRHVLACVEGGEPDPLPVKHYIHTFRYKGVELLTDPARQP